MKTIKIVLLIIFCNLLFTDTTYAADYVLPYPSYMPGHPLYQLSTWWDDLGVYWNFGDIAGIKYQRVMADKYLVEAKTLFGYGQYKLAIAALDKSDTHFAKAIVHAIEIKYKQKDDDSQKELLISQAEKHIEIIGTLSEQFPESIIWDDERTGSENLPISMLFTKSKTIRGYANR